MKWECGIPGKAGGLWEGGLFKLTITFSSDYPANPPKCNPKLCSSLGVFTPPLPHPNVFPSGAVCLSIIGHDWKPSITVKQILLGIQDLLDTPNLKSPANHQYYDLMRHSRADWEAVVRKFAAKHAVEYLDA